MKTIAILEGGMDSDYEDWIEPFELSNEWEVHLIDELYDHPEYMDVLPTLNPDYLWIGTVYLNIELKQQLGKYFEKLKWIPKNVVFATIESCAVFRDLAEKLEAMGTQFFITIPFSTEFEKLKLTDFNNKL